VSDVSRYTTYSLHFFKWAYGTGTGPSTRRCTSSASAACIAVRNETLQRLIEELVITRYARKHHITLTGKEQGQIESAVADLTAPESTTGDLFKGAHLGPAFVRQLLEREAMVQRVERIVSPRSTREGFSYLVRKITIPTGLVPGAAVQKQVLRLATGRTVPAGVSVKLDWIAPFRLSSSGRRALQAARPGDYAGPFHSRAGFVVYNLLRKGSHRYGQPARQLLQNAYFTSWLQTHVRAAHPVCYTASGKISPCPRTDY
jgi:hypothetical protein